MLSPLSTFLVGPRRLCDPRQAQEAALRRREKILEIKDLEFQDTILKFSRFLEESAEKRKRSAAKASAERAAEQAALSRREVVLRQVSAAKDAVRALESQLRDLQRCLLLFF